MTSVLSSQWHTDWWVSSGLWRSVCVRYSASTTTSASARPRSKSPRSWCLGSTRSEPRRRLPDDRPRPGGPLVERVLLDHDPLLGEAALDLLLGADQSCQVRIASSIFGYAPQRHRLPAIACRISSCFGLGFAATSAEAETIWPGVQKPHWRASARTNAATSGCSRSPSIVVTSRSPTVCASVMHDRAGMPSRSTVQAPQWPSPQAIFVPVRPRSSRRTYASGRPTGGSTAWTPPLTLSSSTAGHRQDVRQVDEPKRRARRRHPLALVLDLGQRTPEVASGRQELLDLLELGDAAVPLVARVQGKADDTDGVGLARPEERGRHRQVLVDARERHRLFERRATLRRRRLERRPARRAPGRPPRQHVPGGFLVEAGYLRRPERDEERARLLAVRVVGGVEHLLGRDLVVEVEQVDRAPDGRVEEDARLAGEALRERGEVGDPAVGDDELRLGEALHEPREVVGDRRGAAAAVGGGGDAPGGG